jgi:hypothetical protein
MRFPSIRFVQSLFMLVFLVSSSTGCVKPALVGLTGEVLLDGQPLGNTEIVLNDSQQGLAFVFPTDGEGRFTAKTHHGLGVPPGNYKVFVRELTVTPSSTPLAGNTDLDQPAPPSRIPVKYRTATASDVSLPLTIEEPVFVTIQLLTTGAGSVMF